MITLITVLSPKTASDLKSLSMVVAATVKIHGASFTTDPEDGPLFPAEHTTVIPFATAWNAPMAMGSFLNSIVRLEPSDKDRISTPSAIASSNAANILDPEHPKGSHTWYIAILDPGEPPFAVPSARP